jgi:3-dehydroquinate dehydratase/shikimate dehydrogenase
MPRALIVEAVMTDDLAALRAGRDAAGRADLVELRLDGLRHPDVAGALAGRRAPVIATCRPVWEGGRFEGPESDRLGILKQALELGAEYVDVEWNAPVMRALLGETTRHRVVLSVHDFTGMPADVDRLAVEMGRLSPGVVKIAVTPTRLRDLVALARIGRGATSPTVLIAMGPVGLPTRVAPAHFGSCWTYAGNGVAPGQVPTNRLIDEFRVPAVDPSTPVYAVVGRPISHSVSPAMHNAAFASLGVPGVYIPCQAESIDDFVALADALPIVGASVTAPFKEAAAILTNAEARGESALNTLRRVPGGEWEGLNTDVDGFLAPLDGIELAGRRAAVVGAGGAARSVTEGLRRKQARITVHARRPDAAAGFARELGLADGGWPVPAGSWDLLVNTTPVGTRPDVEATPLAGCVLDGQLVYDLVYNPRPTRLLREAAAAGCRTIDGLAMLVQQAVRQFAWWTGVTPSADVMRAAAERRLGEMANGKWQMTNDE